MSVRLAPLAAHDLAAIKLYLDDAGSLHSNAVIDRLLVSCGTLSLFPHSGLTQKISSGRIVRRMLVERYFILYEVNGPDVSILRILHAHRDLRNIFKLDQDDAD